MAAACLPACPHTLWESALPDQPRSQPKYAIGTQHDERPADRAAPAPAEPGPRPCARIITMLSKDSPWGCACPCACPGCAAEGQTSSEL